MTQPAAHRPAPAPPVAAGLAAHDLVKTYAGSGGPPALAGVRLLVRPGEAVAVMGPSGSGKTTLLHVLAGILTPDTGLVTLDGHPVSDASDGTRTRLRRDTFGFVFQSGQLLPELPAVENVALPLMLAGVDRRTAQARAAELFAPLGLAGLERRRPGELSGGQAQRVAIARALVGRPRVVFADEPTGALDQRTGAEVMHHLTTLTGTLGASLLLVTHDQHVAAWCHRTLHMQDGHIVRETR
ncbi:ABC transporter ATP-binding protein [Luteipulveratus sp. YIM 133132]|uniref:ABC transporter ATP-binding protein n=1 Tax=Luteipulveratus flavus TaxID=3031728 RepID=UPI0023AF2C86|nr:ABC transporter ATP-binding protein [Luteipulveratus sp. YIM 133132]MDE9367620.1 ABC transporter ATP-binding protein [Luteipulveratus sp. YIM 133132]